MSRWEDVNARARGLITHLLSPAQLAQLEMATSLELLAADLRVAGVDVGAETDTAAGLEHEVRRWAAGRLKTLMRWFGARADALAVLLEDEERRSVRALLRGCAQRAPAEERLAGLLPTPALPETALAELAQQPTIHAIVNLLAAWRHPYAEALRSEGISPQPDLMALELSLARAFASRALTQARRGGRGPLLAHAMLVIDLENAQAAMALAGDAASDPRRFFLPGGRRLVADRFQEAARAGTLMAAAEVVAPAFEGTPFAAVIRAAPLDPGRLEPNLLRAEIRQLDQVRRRDPLGATTLLHFMLLLRFQLVELRRIIWSVALSATGAA